MKKNAKKLIYSWDEIPLILDIAYLTTLLGCSREKIRMECQSGRLPAFKIGDMWRVRKDDLIAFTKGETGRGSEK